MTFTNTLTMPARDANALLKYRPSRSQSTMARENLGQSAASTEDYEVRASAQIENETKLLETTGHHVSGQEYFKPIKNWEGVVEVVGETSFQAAMRDVNDPSDRGEETFDIDLEDVEAGDRNLVVPGGIFYFTVGYRIRQGGTRIKGVQMVFRRMPRWSKKDIARLEERTKKLLAITQDQGRSPESETR